MMEKNAWLTKEQLAYLFGCTKEEITACLKEAYIEELKMKSVKQVYQNHTKVLEYYSTEVLFSIGYRIHTKQGIKFRKWATSELMKKDKN